jgi:hypothetical protein
MRTFIIILCALFFSKSQADSKQIDISMLITQSDIIVYGIITEQDELTFTFEIEGGITSDTGIIHVNKFQDWPCGHRWTSYKIGQCLMLFLQRNNNKLTIMGGGDEGEFPIKDNKIYISTGALILPPPPLHPQKIDSSLIFFWPKEIQIDPTHTSAFRGVEWDLYDILSDIQFIRKNLQYTNTPNDNRIKWALVCTRKELLPRVQKSKIVEWCFQDKLGITQESLREH